ncbi:hypothetical protein [Dyadobacter sandarakinus]|uniref:DUF4595 domain-containing protein n=1 Tax=Dyadobacter sandarakinus TaxID=2747268 RepID=A0ABX7ID96_9BACT|nr:hypothetical protein [Dyadobacter sandarakinus]QRR03093.1 hypothetical protein HWI92_20345 [Dyadobacter sandarakinus]
MHLKILLGITISILFFSCKNNINEEPEPQGTEACLVKTYIIGRENDWYEENYFYNSRALLDSIKIESNYHVDIEYDTKGRIQRTNYLTFKDAKFTYDAQNRLKSIGIDYVRDVPLNTNHIFFEYSADNHLMQSTWVPGGIHHLEKYYNPNFEKFMESVLEIYNLENNFWDKKAIKEEIQHIANNKYLVDVQNLTVTKKINSQVENYADEPIIRFEYVDTITKYDGKKSPKGSAQWKALNLLPFNEDFSELGNIVDLANPRPVGWVPYKIVYQYNDSNYPISAIRIMGSDTIQMKWEYQCR